MRREEDDEKGLPLMPSLPFFFPQVDKNLYKSNMDGWSKIMKSEGGIRGL